MATLLLAAIVDLYREVFDMILTVDFTQLGQETLLRNICQSLVKSLQHEGTGSLNKILNMKAQAY